MKNADSADRTRNLKLQICNKMVETKKKAKLSRVTTSTENRLISSSKLSA